jgi:hypothetical protein
MVLYAWNNILLVIIKKRVGFNKKIARSEPVEIKGVYEKC